MRGDQVLDPKVIRAARWNRKRISRRQKIFPTNWNRSCLCVIGLETRVHQQIAGMRGKGGKHEGCGYNENVWKMEIDYLVRGARARRFFCGGDVVYHNRKNVPGSKASRVQTKRSDGTVALWPGKSMPP